MAAVSTFPSDMGLKSGSVEPDPNPWQHHGRSNQDRTATPFTQPFTPVQQADQHPRPNARHPSRQQANGASKYSHAVAQHLNGEQEGRHDSAQTSQTPAPPNGSNFLSPYKHNAANGANGSRSGSEADSLLDLYGQPRSIAGSIERRDNKTPPHTAPNVPNSPEILYVSREDPDSSKWVHRDKLALIESHELQEAGIKIPRHSSLRGRSNSKSKNRRGQSKGHSRGQSVNGEESEMPQSRDGKRQRMRSPERQEEETPDVPMDYDLRTPEEIAAARNEPTSSVLYRQQGLRATSGSSRIPLPTSSPMPIPQEHRERHIPLPRTRGASGSWAGEDDPIAYPKNRRRSHSAGSQILLDDTDPLNGTPTPIPDSTASQQGTPSTSPSKIRSASSKLLPTAAAASARKASAALRNNINMAASEQPQPQAQPKPRSASTNSARGSPAAASATRPKSRSGLEPRPATAINRPEGEAPWLATMYKPDPRLPPDQQVIPTHAKKLQQQQQQREQQQGRSADQQPVDDIRNRGRAQGQRDKESAFSPVAVHTNNGLQPPSPSSRTDIPTPVPSPRALNEKSSAEKPGWPLKVSPSPKPDATNLTASTPAVGGTHNSPGGTTAAAQGGSNNGGYSTMPKVAPSGTSPSTPTHPRTQAMPMAMGMGMGTDEKGVGKEKEKGCGGCCVVM